MSSVNNSECAPAGNEFTVVFAGRVLSVDCPGCMNPGALPRGEPTVLLTSHLTVCFAPSVLTNESRTSDSAPPWLLDALRTHFTPVFRAEQVSVGSSWG